MLVGQSSLDLIGAGTQHSRWARVARRPRPTRFRGGSKPLPPDLEAAFRPPPATSGVGYPTSILRRTIKLG